MRGINPFIPVSAARAKLIKPDVRGSIPVLVRINDKPPDAWRVNMMPAGDGSYYLYLHGDVRKASGTTIGDRVRIEISFDGQYSKGPADPMPAWFSDALVKNRRASACWQALAPSRRKEVLRNFSRLKSEEARKRNLEKALHVLSGGKGRFMARTWNE